MEPAINPAMDQSHYQDHQITQLPDSDSSPSHFPLVLPLQHVRRVQIESPRPPFVGAAKFAVAAIANGQILQAAVDDQIDQRRRGEDGVGDEIAADPVETGARERADNDDGETEFRIEILAHVEIAAAAHGTTIDRTIGADGAADRDRNVAAAAAALDGCR